ncbi:lectin-like [Camellia sinensis]|uniref:lectin-like n=1 Tax=Camellia sinensis TaxID=4442 RepID=UPI001035599A|nr:lectin-like [Camellia sinensis]
MDARRDFDHDFEDATIGEDIEDLDGTGGGDDVAMINVDCGNNDDNFGDNDVLLMSALASGRDIIVINYCYPCLCCHYCLLQKYFVDKKSNKNCFVLFARELNICWNDNPQYWRWTTLKETSGEEIEVAELLQVCWLDVRGQFNGAVDLSPGIAYEIVFVVRMIKCQDFSLKLTIILPNSKKLTRNESLNEKPLGSWFDIQLGEFKMSPENVGTMEFSLEDHTELWKSGLIVKYAIIRPKEPE